MSVELFTPEKLLELALTAEAEYLELSKEFGPGTYHQGRNEARDRRDAAQIAAVWLEKRGGGPLPYVGIFGQVPFVRGQRVRIKKGARVFGIKDPREGTVLKRDLVVKLHFVDGGWIDFAERRNESEMVRQPKVTWAGTGGYWRWAEATDVEAYEPASSSPAAAKPDDRPSARA